MSAHILENSNEQEEGKYPKELIQIYQDIKSKYRNYDTRNALKRMQAFRKALVNLSEQGFSVGLELLGSLNFGIVERNSDADVIILHYCNIHRKEKECLPSCPNLIFERETIARFLAKSLNMDSFHIETLDCINLHCIEDYKEGRIDKKDSRILRFLFYFALGRPVNQTLFSHHYRTLNAEKSLRKYFYTWASEALAIYLRTSTHRLSFHKYNERILSQGLKLPSDLRKELQYYLDKEQTER